MTEREPTKQYRRIRHVLYGLFLVVCVLFLVFVGKKYGRPSGSETEIYSLALVGSYTDERGIPILYNSSEDLESLVGNEIHFTGHFTEDIKDGQNVLCYMDFANCQIYVNDVLCI